MPPAVRVRQQHQPQWPKNNACSAPPLSGGAGATGAVVCSASLDLCSTGQISSGVLEASPSAAWSVYIYNIWVCVSYMCHTSLYKEGLSEDNPRRTTAVDRRSTPSARGRTDKNICRYFGARACRVFQKKTSFLLLLVSK